MQSAGSRSIVLGFLAVRESADGLRGGYLLVTEYGRPIEFHYTSPLRYTRQHRVLYGKAFETCAHAEAIAKPLTDQQSMPPRIVLVDRPSLLELRRLIPAPVVVVSATEGAEAGVARPVKIGCHRDHPEDQQAFERIESLLGTPLDWLEPFDRIALALAELDPIRSAA